MTQIHWTHKVKKIQNKFKCTWPEAIQIYKNNRDLKGGIDWQKIKIPLLASLPGLAAVGIIGHKIATS